MEATQLSRSKQVISKTLFKALQLLKEFGGSLPGREVISKLGEQLNFTEWEKERFEKSGYIRWQSMLHFHSIGAIKAGFLVKKSGVWYLTKEGEEALDLGALGLMSEINNAYKKWAKNRAPEVDNEIPNESAFDGKQHIEANLSQLEEQASEGLIEFIRSKNPYEFQDMVAGLLEAMGYYVSFISPKGKDGGLDVVVYADPLGAKEPRIKVQVKHRPDANIAVGDIRALLGLLNKSGDVGLFVTSGVFSSEAERFARDSHQHIDLIDIQRFIDLWKEFYLKMTDETKEMMSLKPIYFLSN